MTGTVTIRPVSERDADNLIEGHIASRALHGDWAQPFADQAGFATWYGGVLIGDRVPFVVESDGNLAGLVTFSGIIMGAFRSAFLGYHGIAGGSGAGAMTQGVRLTVAHGFGVMGLHRVEANIQPGNHRSIALVRRLGFRQEGFSPRYLNIAGEWRDHERWALLADD